MIFYTLPVIMISIVINLPKFLETKAVATKSSPPHLVNVSFLLNFLTNAVDQSDDMINMQIIVHI